MPKGLSLALLVVGVVLGFWGIMASNSVSSDVSRLFTGAPTDKTVWLLAVGGVAIIIGLYGLLVGGKSN